MYYQMSPEKLFCLYNTSCMKMITFDIFKRYWWTILLFEFHLWLLPHEGIWSFSKRKLISVSLFLWVRSSQNTPKSLSEVHCHLMHMLSVFRCTFLWNQFTLLSKSGVNGEYRVWGKRSEVENVRWNWLCRDKPSPTSPGSKHIPCLPFSFSHDQTITFL